MQPIDIISAFFGLFAIALLGASIIVWGIVVYRWINDLQPLRLEPRRPVGWSFDAIVFAVGATVVLASGTTLIAQLAGWVEVSKNDATSTPPLSNAAVLISLEGASRILACGLLLGWLIMLYRVHARDLGIALVARHFKIGIAATAALLPPLYLLQFLLTIYWVEYKHPVLDLLSEANNPMYLVPMAVVACIVAPLSEEFVFRVVLQGWLESSAMKQADGHSLQSGEDVAWIDSDEDEQTNVPYWPILVSSFCFAIVHIGHGPAPVSLFFFALGLGYLYRQTHSIWPSLIVHFALNAITIISAGINLLIPLDAG
ncbi:MAG: CPBP family intramembrane glutamic endopeptidase [Pirellulaceae bacterium]